MSKLYLALIIVSPIVTLINTITLSIYYQKINIVAQRMERDVYKTKNLLNAIYGTRLYNDTDSAIRKAYREGETHAKRG